MKFLLPLLIGFLLVKKSSTKQKSKFLLFPVINSTKENTPLIIFLHGRGSDENQLRNLIPKNINANLIFLRANNKKRLFFNIRLKENNEQLAKEIQVVGKDLENLISKLKKKYKTDKVIAFGFSQGAALALYLGSVNKVSSVIGFSGSLPPPLFPSGKDATSIYMFAGLKDSLVPYNLAKDTYEAFKSQNYKIELVTENIGHNFPKQEIISEFLEKALND